MLTSIFILVATFLFLVLAVIWTTQNVLNVFVKIVFWLLTAFGGYLLLGEPNLIATVFK